jgi:hypothetical protein
MLSADREQLSKMFDILRRALQPFVERQMRAEYGDRWLKAIAEVPRSRSDRVGSNVNLSDPDVLLSVIWDRWEAVFKRKLDRGDKSAVNFLREARDKWAHWKDFDENDIVLAMSSAVRLLRRIDAKEAIRVQELTASPSERIIVPPVTAASQPATSRPAQRISNGYWVYENWTIGKAVIHRSYCTFCNDGRGIHHNAGSRNGKWHGPFESRPAANEAAGKLGQPIRSCSRCAA